MTTTIAPSVGGGALFTQQGRGTSPGFDALDLRRAKSNGQIQEGVYAAGDYMVTQRGAGANMTVDIAASSGASAEVQGDTITGQGLYTVGPHSATINEAITTADATNPRVDQVILEVQDNVHDASGGNLARTRVLTGTATAGATLTNRTGAAALPGNALLLADVLVGAAAGSITNAVIRDRRKWARGAYVRILRSSGNITTAGTTAAAIDSSALNPRIECSGAPVRWTLRPAVLHSVANAEVGFQPWVDGAAVDGPGTSNATFAVALSTATNASSPALTYDYVPSAGSHQFQWAWFVVTAGTGTIASSATAPLVFTVEEVVRQNTANNTTTTG